MTPVRSLKPFRYHTLDVFTDRTFGGNPLAVFPNAVGLTAKQMQQVAREINLSETAFVFPPRTPDGTKRVRIFTPEVELPFAGHPTIGTAHLLSAIGAIDVLGDEAHLVLEEEVGPVRVTVRLEQHAPVFVQLTAAAAPEFRDAPPIADIAAALSLPEDAIRFGNLEPQAVSCGVPFLFVPLRDRASLEHAHVVREEWERRIRHCWAPHIFVFTGDSQNDDPVIRARMFAPALGLAEDPATGAAATALAAYLGVREREWNCTRRWTVLQGVEMNRPSILHAEAVIRKGAIHSLHVGGSCIAVSEATMLIPAASA